MKIIVTWIKPFIKDLIGQAQLRFLENRRASDNAMLVQELLHHQNTKYRKGYLLANIDLEKASDQLEWSFIYDTLF